MNVVEIRVDVIIQREINGDCSPDIVVEIFSRITLNRMITRSREIYKFFG